MRGVDVDQTSFGCGVCGGGGCELWPETQEEKEEEEEEGPEW